MLLKDLPTDQANGILTQILPTAQTQEMHAAAAPSLLLLLAATWNNIPIDDPTAQNLGLKGVNGQPAQGEQLVRAINIVSTAHAVGLMSNLMGKLKNFEQQQAEKKKKEKREIIADIPESMLNKGRDISYEFAATQQAAQQLFSQGNSVCDHLESFQGGYVVPPSNTSPPYSQLDSTLYKVASVLKPAMDHALAVKQTVHDMFPEPESGSNAATLREECEMSCALLYRGMKEIETQRKKSYTAVARAVQPAFHTTTPPLFSEEELKQINKSKTTASTLQPKFVDHNKARGGGYRGGYRGRSRGRGWRPSYDFRGRSNTPPRRNGGSGGGKGGRSGSSDGGKSRK